MERGKQRGSPKSNSEERKWRRGVLDFIFMMLIRSFAHDNQQYIFLKVDLTPFSRKARQQKPSAEILYSFFWGSYS